MDAVHEYVVDNGGFIFDLFSKRTADYAQFDPRPKCVETMRSACKKGSWQHDNALLYIFTRKD